MKSNELLTLIGEIDKCVERLQELDNFCHQAKQDLAILGKEKKYDLVVLAEIFSDYYTCLETVFVRISKFFENNLEKSRWHADLLDRMVLNIPGIRKRVLRDETHNILKEFLRFRHFKRYYFEFDYDRDRIEFLERKYSQSHPMMAEDLKVYKLFLENLNSRAQ